MSRESEVKSSNTRLATKSNSLPTTNPSSSKDGAAANRALMEKENKLREELTSKLKGQVDALVDSLEAGGVPKDPCINEIMKQLLSYCRATENGGTSQLNDIATSLEQANNAVDLSLSYADCYHAIDIDRLIPVLDELQSVIVDLARLVKKHVQRKLLSVQNNSKADSSLLPAAKGAARQIEDIVVQCSITSCRTRALKLCLQH